MTEKQLKTGTTTLSLMCKDGIVIAADKRATAGNFIASKKIDKIIKITDDIVVTTAGTVSDIQLVTKIIRAELKLKSLKTGKLNTVKEAVNLLSGIVYNNIRRYSIITAISHFIVSGRDDTGYHVYDLSPDGAMDKIDDFVSSGSGSILVYGLLEQAYKKDMTVKEGIVLAEKCINTAISRDSASGNGMDVYTITDEGVNKILTKKVNMALQ